MLLYLMEWLNGDVGVPNLFRYLTFRTGGSLLTALIASLWMGPFVIGWLRRLQASGQPIRADGPQQHLETKKGTPTMGGVLILLSMSGSVLFWTDWSTPYVWILLGIMLAFGMIGFADDYLKVVKRNTAGLSGRKRLVLGASVSLLAASLIYNLSPESLHGYLTFPVFKDALLYMGFLLILFWGFIIVGSANAVNLTDGLDGLATMPVIIASGAFVLIAYLVGNIKFSTYLQIHYIPDAGEIAVFLSALIGACLGFLWFNAQPADVFMGDTGSLSLGAGLGTVAAITRHEIVWAIIGGLFVIETLSVMIQVFYFRRTGKRIFRMAPLHHHFEQLGWKESKVVIRFWIVAVILALIGLSTLKIR